MMKAKKGQGVVEYAGALVVAAVIISAVVALAPDALDTMFTNVLDNIQAFLESNTPT